MAPDSTTPFAPTVSFITLAVADVARAAAFYEHLGLRRHEKSAETYAFFQLNGVVLALFGADHLPELWGGDPVGAAPRVALSHNVVEEAHISAILERVVQAGGQVCVPEGPTPWGGTRAWFADLDGHRWELVHNPRLLRDAVGGAWLSPRSTP
jgi:catechol 2,3-dioxygenase-like lactoylglutathione lyase family enzyme